VIAHALQRCRRSNSVAFAVWAGLILLIAWASLNPDVRPPSNNDMDKLLHVMAYAVIAGAPFMVFGTWHMASLVAMSVPLMGVLIELGQTLVPGRSGDLLDVAADCLGALAGTIVSGALRARADTSN
jgi:VanZ family protein